MNDITVQNKVIQEITDEKLIEYINTFHSNQLSQQETKQFIEIAKAYNLNPFKKEIYCISFNARDGRKLSILTGYEVYIKKAERTGLLTGWKAWTEGEVKDRSLKGCIEIHKKGWDKPFYHEVDFVEYNQNNHFWNEKPKTMIKKVAIAQGFRLAFADDLGGAPYTADEVSEGSDIKEINPVVEAEKPQKTTMREDILYIEIEKTKQLYKDISFLDSEEQEKLEKLYQWVIKSSLKAKSDNFDWFIRQNADIESFIKISKENKTIKPEIDNDVDENNLTFGMQEEVT